MDGLLFFKFVAAATASGAYPFAVVPAVDVVFFRTEVIFLSRLVFAVSAILTTSFFRHLSFLLSFYFTGERKSR